MTEKFSK